MIPIALEDVIKVLGIAPPGGLSFKLLAPDRLIRVATAQPALRTAEISHCLDFKHTCFQSEPNVAAIWAFQSTKRRWETTAKCSHHLKISFSTIDLKRDKSC